MTASDCRNSIVLFAFFWFSQANGLDLRGTECPHMDNYPASKCNGIYLCLTLDKYLDTGILTLEGVRNCGIHPQMELVCCPNEYPVTNPSPTHRLKEPLENDLESFGHLVPLRYYKNENFDAYKYSCTGVLISNQFILTTRVCLGKTGIENPNAVRLGLLEGKWQHSEVLTKNWIHENDLVILQMKSKLNQTLAPDAKVAQICNSDDVLNRKSIFAVAFAQNNRENCGLFKQEMVMHSFSSCGPTQFQKSFEVNVTRFHWCLSAIRDSGIFTKCTNCLRGSASVLHVHRSDGSHCVAGIATATSNECQPLAAPLYYTNLLAENNINFINEKLYNNRVQFRSNGVLNN